MAFVYVVTTGGLGSALFNFYQGLISRNNTSGPGRPGAGSGGLLLRGLLTGAPKVGSGGLGLDLIIFLLRGLLAGAPEAAPAGLGLDLFIFLLKSY